MRRGESSRRALDRMVEHEVRLREVWIGSREAIADRIDQERMRQLIEQGAPTAPGPDGTILVFDRPRRSRRRRWRIRWRTLARPFDATLDLALAGIARWWPKPR